MWILQKQKNWNVSRMKQFFFQIKKFINYTSKATLLQKEVLKWGWLSRLELIDTFYPRVLSNQLPHAFHLCLPFFLATRRLRVLSTWWINPLSKISHPPMTLYCNLENLYQVVGLFSIIKLSKVLFFKKKKGRQNLIKKSVGSFCPFYQISFHPYSCCYNLWFEVT